jgi:hypothetical protein
MSLSIRARFEPLRTLGFAAIGPAYMGVGTAIDHPIRQFLIQNQTDVLLVFSFDGINDHFDLPKDGYWVEDVTANKTNTQGLFFAEGDRLYVRQDTAAPTRGKVSFSAIYGADD